MPRDSWLQTAAKFSPGFAFRLGGAWVVTMALKDGPREDARSSTVATTFHMAVTGRLAVSIYGRVVFDNL